MMAPVMAAVWPAIWLMLLAFDGSALCILLMVALARPVDWLGSAVVEWKRTHLKLGHRR